MCDSTKPSGGRVVSLAEFDAVAVKSGVTNRPVALPTCTSSGHWGGPVLEPRVFVNAHLADGRDSRLQAVFSNL
jgi:hypothetical protein